MQIGSVNFRTWIAEPLEIAATAPFENSAAFTASDFYFLLFYIACVAAPISVF